MVGILKLKDLLEKDNCKYFKNGTSTYPLMKKINKIDKSIK